MHNSYPVSVYDSEAEVEEARKDYLDELYRHIGPGEGVGNVSVWNVQKDKRFNICFE